MLFGSDVLQVIFFFFLKWQNPGEMKRAEVSRTVTKKLDSFAGLGEIKRREVDLDPQVSPEEIKSREVELG